jgi:hypothetical protein
MERVTSVWTMEKRTMAQANLERKPNFPYDPMLVGHGHVPKERSPLDLRQCEDWS